MPIYGWVAFAILGTGLIILVIGGSSDSLFGIDPGQLAGITASLALLVFLGGGVIGPGQPIAPLLRYLFIWGVGLILLVVGYQLFQSFG